LSNFQNIFRDLFIIVFPGHLHEAHNGNSEKATSHKAKKKLQHNSILPNAFQGETNKNDKIRTLAWCGFLVSRYIKGKRQTAAGRAAP